VTECPTPRRRLYSKQISRARNFDLDLGWGHTALRHASGVDLYLHAKVEETFCGWTDRRTDGRTDILDRFSGRLVGVNLKIVQQKEITVEQGLLDDGLVTATKPS